MQDDFLQQCQELGPLCKKIGNDPLLVQGGGGNISWKDKESDILWIKASGTSLRNVGTKGSMVAIELEVLLSNLRKGNYTEEPILTQQTTARASIETPLHALMPQKYVLHLHSVNALSMLVRENPRPILHNIFKSANISWEYIPYVRPGAKLAEAVALGLNNKHNSKLNVLFLGNHGIVLGATCVDELFYLLQYIESFLEERVCPMEVAPYESQCILTPPALAKAGYSPVNNVPIVHQLALSTVLLKRVKYQWALYPDHVVFLGPKAHVYSIGEISKCTSLFPSSPIVFIEDIGVFQHKTISNAQLELLLCYYNVVSRVPHSANLSLLSDDEVTFLLEWDAEKHRQQSAHK